MRATVFAIYDALQRRRWTADSGAVYSVTNSLDALNHGDRRDTMVTFRVANGQTVKAEAVGTATICLRTRRRKRLCLQLSRVYYSPAFSGNLLSVRELVRENDVLFHFQSDRAELRTPDGERIPLDSEYTVLAEAMGLTRVTRPHGRRRRFSRRLSECRSVPCASSPRPGASA